MEEKHMPDKKIIEMIQERLDYLRFRTDFFDILFKGIIGYAVIAADFDGNIIAYNEGARQIYGYTPEEVIGKKNFDEFLPKDFVESGRFGKMVDNLLDKGGYSYEGEKVGKDGVKFPAKIVLMLTKSVEGNIIGFIEVAEDLTERKKWEAEIKKLNEELEQKVVERTMQLDDANKILEKKLDELQRFHKIAVGREFRVDELKQENKRLQEWIADLEGRLIKIKGYI